MKRLALLVALIMGLTLGVAAVAAAHTLGKPAKNTFYVVGGSESAKEVGYKDGLKYTFKHTQTDNDYSHFKAWVRIENLAGSNKNLTCTDADKKLANYKLYVWHHSTYLYRLDATDVFCTYNKNFSKTLGPGQVLNVWIRFRYTPQYGTNVVLRTPWGWTGHVDPYSKRA